MQRPEDGAVHAAAGQRPTASAQRGSRTHNRLALGQAVLPVGASGRARYRGSESNRTSPGSKPGALAIELPRTRDGWIRTSVLVLPRHATTPGWSAPRVTGTVSEAGFEPAFSNIRNSRPLQAGPLAEIDGRTSRGSVQRYRLATPPMCARGRRWESNPQPSVPKTDAMPYVSFQHGIRSSEHLAGLEPAPPTWQAGRLPVKPHRCLIAAELSRIMPAQRASQWDQRDLNSHQPV